MWTILCALASAFGVLMAAFVGSCLKGYGVVRGLRLELHALSETISAGRSPVEGRRRTARVFAIRRHSPRGRFSSTPRRQMAPPVEMEMSTYVRSEIENGGDSMPALVHQLPPRTSPMPSPMPSPPPSVPSRPPRHCQLISPSLKTASQADSAFEEVSLV